MLDAAIENEVVWTPSAEVIARSRLRSFYERQGFASYDDWFRHSVSDSAAYWGAVVEDVELEWSSRYERVLDLSKDTPWAEWFTGGRFNYAVNALDRHVARGAGERT